MVPQRSCIVTANIVIVSIIVVNIIAIHVLIAMAAIAFIIVDTGSITAQLGRGWGTRDWHWRLILLCACIEHSFGRRMQRQCSNFFALCRKLL